MADLQSHDQGVAMCRTNNVLPISEWLEQIHEGYSEYTTAFLEYGITSSVSLVEEIHAEDLSELNHALSQPPHCIKPLQRNNIIRAIRKVSFISVTVYH